MVHYFKRAKNLTKKLDFPNVLQWDRIGLGASIPNCINSKEAFKTMKAFAINTGIDLDRLFALTAFMLALIPAIKEPKAIAETTVDFEGVHDFNLVIDDYIDVYKNKKPLSRPKHDPQRKLVKMEVKTVHVTYMFGIEFNPRTKLMRLRSRLFPQKNLWGFRYEEKYRAFKELLDYIAPDIQRYFSEDQREYIPDEIETIVDEVEADELEEEL